MLVLQHQVANPHVSTHLPFVTTLGPLLFVMYCYVMYSYVMQSHTTVDVLFWDVMYHNSIYPSLGRLLHNFL